MRTILMVIVIGGALIAFVLQIPDLAIGLTTMIDSAIDSDLTTLLSNVYDTIPTDLMNLLTIAFSVLVITIIISHLTGGKK
jgi:hypothetical protein